MIKRIYINHKQHVTEMNKFHSKSHKIIINFIFLLLLIVHHANQLKSSIALSHVNYIMPACLLLSSKYI